MHLIGNNLRPDLRLFCPRPVISMPPLFSRAPGRPMCKFGAGCYRQNPQHFAEYDHPSDHSLFIQDTAGPAPPPAPAATGPTQADPFATTRFPGATEADRARARLAAVPLLRDVVRVLEDHPHQLAHFSKLGYRGFQVRPPAARYVVQSEGLTAKKIELIAPLASAHAYAEWAVPLPVASRVGWTCGERDLVRTGHTPPHGYGKYHYFVQNGLMNKDGTCGYSFTNKGHFNDHLVVFHFNVELASGLTYEETPVIEALYRGKLTGFGTLRDTPEAAAERGLLEKLRIQWSHIIGSLSSPSLPSPVSLSLADHSPPHSLPRADSAPGGGGHVAADTPMEDVFPTIYSVPFYDEECFLDYTTGIVGAHIPDGERAARLLSRTQAREFRQTGGTSEHRAAGAPRRINHNYCLVRVWLYPNTGQFSGQCSCDTHRPTSEQRPTMPPRLIASQKAKLALVDANELDPTVALPRTIHILNPQNRPSILCVPIGQLEANVNRVIR